MGVTTNTVSVNVESFLLEGAWVKLRNFVSACLADAKAYGVDGLAFYNGDRFLGSIKRGDLDKALVHFELSTDNVIFQRFMLGWVVEICCGGAGV